MAKKLQKQPSKTKKPTPIPRPQLLLIVSLLVNIILISTIFVIAIKTSNDYFVVNRGFSTFCSSKFRKNLRQDSEGQENQNTIIAFNDFFCAGDDNMDPNPDPRNYASGCGFYLYLKTNNIPFEETDDNGNPRSLDDILENDCRIIVK
jgi:hypothetical protein